MCRSMPITCDTNDRVLLKGVHTVKRICMSIVLQ